MGFFFGRNPTTKGLRDSGHVMFDHPDIGAFGGACLAHGIRKEHSTQFDFESARGGPLHDGSDVFLRECGFNKYGRNAMGHYRINKSIDVRNARFRRGTQALNAHHG